MPLTIVTASVDRIDLLAPIPRNKDMVLSGFVSFTGKTSMEISIQLETLKEENAKSCDTLPLLAAKFTMAIK